MYKIYKSHHQSVVSDETLKIYCIVSNEEADVIIKGVQHMLVLRETLYTTLDMLNEYGYKKENFIRKKVAE